MKQTLLAIASLCILATSSAAETVRFEYDSEASFSRTQIFTFPFSSGPTIPAAGQYNGRVGLVDGYMDVETIGTSNSVVDFDFDVQLPHGLPIGLTSSYGAGNGGYFDAFASLTLNAANGGTVSRIGQNVLIEQNFGFDTRYGPGYALYGGGHPQYDPNDDTLYPFKMALRLEQTADGTSYFLNSLFMTCEERDSRGNVSADSCNGYFEDNHARWYGSSTTRNPSASYVVNNVTPSISAVPLPAGLPLLLAGVGGLAFLRRKAT